MGSIILLFLLFYITSPTFFNVCAAPGRFEASLYSVNHSGVYYVYGCVFAVSVTERVFFQQ